METAAGAMNTSMRRAHSEEMLSELDLNMIGSSSNEKECDQQKQSRKPSSTNNKSSQHHNQNGELSSTELEEEEDMPNYRYSHQGQSLCVSDLPRMRRNSDQGVDVSKWPKNIWDQILGLKIKEAEHGERHEYRSIETDIFAHRIIMLVYRQDQSAGSSIMSSRPCLLYTSDAADE